MPRPASLAASRTAALVASASSVLFASGLAVSLSVALRSFERGVDGEADAVDLDQTAVALWWAADVGVRWALVSAGGSICGVLGLVLRRASVHRVFALTTAFDLLATVFLTLTLLLLTFSPSLSEPFGDFVCSSIYATDLSRSTRTLLARLSEHAAFSWTTGVDLSFSGVEACEDAWQGAVLHVLVGCVITIALRAYGTWVTWDANVELRENELRAREAGAGWERLPGGSSAADAAAASDDEADDADDEKGLLEKAVRRLSVTAERPQVTPLVLEEARVRYTKRSHTLPLLSIQTSATGGSPRPDRTRPRGRAQTAFGAWEPRSATSSRSSSRDSTEARLVFVPFTLDSHGHPVYAPSSPTYAVPGSPRSSSPARTGTPPPPPATSSRPNLRMRQRSSSSVPTLGSAASSVRDEQTPPPLTPPPVLCDEPGSLLSDSPPFPARRCSSTCLKPEDDDHHRHLLA